MTLRRILILAGILLIFFLGIYSWNRRTHVLDETAANIGLEASYLVLAPLNAVRDSAGGIWKRYFDLVDVREENLKLKAQVDDLNAKLVASGEDLAELARLRALVDMPIDAAWKPLGCRVLSGRLGPNAVLDSVTISRGYANGAKPGMPLVTNLGLVGKVLRASPHAATVLLVTDPKSRIAVFGQESRAPGILKGKGMANGLEVDFVQRDSPVKNGEVLVTSGLDGKYPKGLPVARVDSVAPSDYTQFMAVSAMPLVDFSHLEEALLLERTGIVTTYDEPDEPLAEIVGPPLPPRLEKIRKDREARAPGAQPNGADAALNAAPGQSGQNASGQNSSGQNSPAQNSGVQNVSGQQPGAGQNAPAQNASGQEASAQNASGQPAPSREGSAQNASGQNATGQNAVGRETGRENGTRQNQPLRPTLRGGNEIPRNAEGAPRWRVITP